MFMCSAYKTWHLSASSLNIQLVSWGRTALHLQPRLAKHISLAMQHWARPINGIVQLEDLVPSLHLTTLYLTNGWIWCFLKGRLRSVCLFAMQHSTQLIYRYNSTAMLIVQSRRQHMICKPWVLVMALLLDNFVQRIQRLQLKIEA